ncbi:MAG TPA: RNA-binding cell elongation regulator Jag/EloR [Anaerolineaceae bacterium]|nr:RNA-binding cell elongation regulator Jag/EloR [Anaerolineaceae bacterium]
MGQEKTTLEIIAPTVDEAITRGLGQLGLSLDTVDVEVLDQGSRGLFGLGSRQARVRLSIRSAVTASEKEKKPNPISRVVKAAQENHAVISSATIEETPAPVNPKAELDQSEENDPTLRMSAAVVRDLLEKMKVKATLTVKYIDSEDPSEPQSVLVDIQGDDLSILIGRRSETLNALQYIASLIVGKQAGHWVSLMIDVQGYRTRRERQLRQLARRMADQALHTGRRQVLEPMPANERRLIHIELRDHTEVTTESIGEEPNRKVTINPKK